MSDKLDDFKNMIFTDHQVSCIFSQEFQAFAFKIEDDQGEVSIIKLPGSLHISGLPGPLLVSRHWSKQERDKTPHPAVMWASFGDK